MTELYRHFDADRRLLYVGVSLSAPLRIRAHRRTSLWLNQVVTITIERFETRQLALAAEKAAIKRERPRFNTIHTGIRMKEPPPQAPLAERLRRKREARIAAEQGAE